MRKHALMYRYTMSKHIKGVPVHYERAITRTLNEGVSG